MSTWSASAYPPPRRSRSRSPRGAFPSRPPYPDSYAARAPERPWPDYERDRVPYDHVRRGRSRTPPPDESRKRRRSMSPYDRERYDPRPRYGDDHAPVDPRTMDHPATLKQYAEWFRYYFPQQATEEDNADKAAEQEAGDGSKPRNGIRARWEKYKKEFMSTQLQTMFEHHRKSPWFAEKYDPAPELLVLRRRLRKDGWKGHLQSFVQDLELGKFDPDLNEQSESSAQHKDSALSGDVGENVVPVEEVKNTADDDMQFAMDAEEDPGEHDASRVENGKATAEHKRSNRGEEISVPPEGNQVMIRTIPPDIGRLKLEEACSKIPGFMYLALGDPLQKRNFYRAGWIKFRDDADMTAVMSELTDKKIEGFKLHVSHNTRPFINRVRYVPEVASRPDRVEKDLANVKILASILEEEYTTLFKSSASSTGGDSMETNGGTRPEDVGMQADNEDDSMLREPGSEAVERRIEKLVGELHEQGIDERVLEAKKAVISLDLYIAYLRAAYHTCYYCAVVTDHLEELQRKCLKHMRKPLSKSLLEEVKAAETDKAEKERKGKEEEREIEIAVMKPFESRDWKRNDERWLEWFDTKIALLIDRNGVDPRDYGGKSYDEELSKAVEPFIKQEDEGRFRCKTCQKLFKATSFVEKHIANKHADLVKQLDEIPYFNNFALDPHRIQPFTHPPPMTGNSQAPPQAYGIQGPSVYIPEYGRPNLFYGGHPAAYVPPPPPYMSGGYWDPYGYQYPPGSFPPPPPPRRDEATTARRLSDRISGYAPGFDQPVEITVPAAAGLPAKPVMALDAPLGGHEANGRKGRRQGTGGAPPPPPPPDAKEDPRAAAGKKVSYHDMDLVAEGDVELTY
ncbi:hypothetical protein EV363DRAFT_1365569 [Boletus edulis]|nr:hypothetical protein EV363DRAFT_1365569 [Boletus edulis]